MWRRKGWGSEWSWGGGGRSSCRGMLKEEEREPRKGENGGERKKSEITKERKRVVRVM